MIRTKLVGKNDEQALSPVIGVILMVAITVVLTAVVAAFVLGIGQGTDQTAQAAIAFNEGDDNVTVTVTAVERADTIYIEGTKDCDHFQDNTGTRHDRITLDAEAGTSQFLYLAKGITGHVTGDEFSCGSADFLADDGQIQIIGVLDGERTVITTYDV